MMKDSLWSVAQYQSLNGLTARYLYNRIKSALTVCQLSWGIQFAMICQQQCRGHPNIQMVGSRILLEGEWDVVGFFFLSALSFSLSPFPPLSHKSNLLNSCLHSEIILRLFFTVAAQWWICKRLLRFKKKKIVRCACLVLTQECRNPAWFEGKHWEERWLNETGSWIFYSGGWRALCLQRLLLLELQTTGGFPICLSKNTFTFPPRKGYCRTKLALTGFEYRFTKVNSHFCSWWGA